jgi:mono/diheme cytochrome c family protein
VRNRYWVLGAGYWVLVTMLAPAAGAQSNGAAAVRSSRDGVYSEAQAARGREVYELICASCHTAASHTGPVFAAKWQGRPLWELFRFVSEAMPKSEPGSLTQREYTRVTAYLLKMNGMPAGAEELSADSLALKKIRFELKPDSVQQR